MEKINEFNEPLIRKAPFLDMTDLYTVPGSAQSVIDSLAVHPEAQRLFEAEIAYSRGDVEKVFEHSSYFLEHHSGMYAVVSAGMLLALMKNIPYITEPLIAQAVAAKTVIPEIYLRLLCAVAYHQTGDEETAIKHIDKAVALALPDKLLGILAEHRRQLDYLLDDRLRIADEEAYHDYLNLHKTLLKGWTRLHNSVLKRNVSAELTVRERQIARFAVYGCSNLEISKRLKISEASAKKALYDAMNKTGVNKRKELGAFV